MKKLTIDFVENGYVITFFSGTSAKTHVFASWEAVLDFLADEPQ